MTIYLIITLLLGVALGVSATAVFSSNQYDKGFRDGGAWAGNLIESVQILNEESTRMKKTHEEMNKLLKRELEKLKSEGENE